MIGRKGLSVRIPEGVESVQTGKLTDERICMMVNQKYLDKAEVLIEALPYIQRFNRKIIVVKYGGSAMVDEEYGIIITSDDIRQAKTIGDLYSIVKSKQ